MIIYNIDVYVIRPLKPLFEIYSQFWILKLMNIEYIPRTKNYLNATQYNYNIYIYGDCFTMWIILGMIIV